MALLIQKQDKRQSERIKVTLPPDVAEDLATYAAMTESTFNHVITESLRHVFERDRKELREYKAEHQQVPPLAQTRPKSSPNSGPKAVTDGTKTLAQIA